MKTLETHYRARVLIRIVNLDLFMQWVVRYKAALGRPVDRYCFFSLRTYLELVVYHCVSFGPGVFHYQLQVLNRKVSLMATVNLYQPIF